MAQHLTFEVPSCFEDDSIQLPCDGDYPYWLQLLDRYISRADRVEIHCWDGEEAALNDLFAQCSENDYEVIRELQMTRVCLGLSPSLVEYLQTSSIDEQNRMKWFALWLFQGDTCLFCSDHWGVESYIPNVEMPDVEAIQQILPADTNFHLYEAVKD
ncbi:hypothetical protein [Sporosarcina koreensis]|uniref:hypothetical protein n=1 Tax=Sporosarcina koreensis TaxID=334735 RepID=UPI00058F9D62|nr:hypothetical protein [Sporosarcina koreensis]